MKHFDYESIRDKVIDAYGRRVVLSLFSEFSRTGFTPLWSLYKDWKPIYLEAEDPTEYEAAMRLIGDYDHWLLIRNHTKIAPIIDKWALELEVKMRSDAVRKMIRHSASNQGTAAAKWIAEGGFAMRDKRTKRGKEDEDSVKVGVSERLHEDMERLGISVVKGGK
jgi:hypothetical protein